MKTSRLLAGLGAVAMATTSVAATAGTRAADASNVAVQPVKLSSVSGDVARSTLTKKNKSELGGTGLVIAIIAGLAVIGGVIAAASDDDRSSGA
ncbi:MULTISPECIES: hypothetical protein [Qipengyuania]|jgi:hypothetical protein|uniref:Secreted protein n=1 Tax=Qipengyuania mesophila TaxID=2867246 RepID=A0ABS7JQY1_9SPHN|nr:hypothetical protein [Qipengyuania mesophila]MBX7500037.1 hypothetical protein [Qipengyuania mesophila]